MTLPARGAQAFPASFSATAEAHLDDVYGYLVYLTRDRTLAEDLQQPADDQTAQIEDTQREIALRVLLELDGDEAARVLGISPTAVSTRLSRALTKLEERMTAHV